VVADYKFVCMHKLFILVATLTYVEFIIYMFAVFALLAYYNSTICYTHVKYEA